MNVARFPRLVLALLVSAAAVPARADAPSTRAGIRAAVDVAAMDLDVVATAKDGRAVTDLTRAEISVTVDGKPVALDYFARVEAGQLHGPDLSTASPDLILETTAAGADRFLPRQFLVFFDDQHLLPFERKRVLEGLRDFATRLSPSDAMAILACNSSTRVFVPFTNSKEDLLAGLGSVEKETPRGLHWDLEYRQAIQDARRARGATSRDSVVRNWGAQAWARDKGTLDEFRRAVEALGARAGKRVLLFVSHGIELRPGQSLAQALGGTALNQFDYSVQEPYRAVLDAANRAGITIHALDARGLGTDVDAGESQPPAIDPFLANANRRELLAGFADETGGVFVENRNGFGPALDRIMRESAGYYAVGVTLTSLDPKKPRHEVRVSTSRPGVTVRTRRGYTPQTAADAARDHMEMSLITPDAGGDFAVALKTDAPKKGAGLGRRIVPFVVVVPISSFTFLDEGGKKRAVVEVILAAAEDSGARSEPVTDRREIVVSAEVLAKSAGEPFVYRGEFKSGKGNIRFVASVRDVATNRIGVGSASVKVE